TWSTLWLGDFTGIIVVAPVLLLWAERPEISVRPGRVAEAVLLLASLFAMIQIIFAETGPFPTLGRPYSYWLMPFIIWAAIRFGQRNAMTLNLLLSGALVSNTVLGTGPFAGHPSTESFLLLQGFVGVATVITLTLSTVIAERKRIEAQLEESEEQYRTLFEQSPSGVLLIDPKSASPTLFNDVAHAQLGYTRDEFAQLSISDFQASETPEQTRAHIELILADGTYRFETKHRTKDGSIRDVLVTGKTIELRGKTVILAIVRDITDIKQAERALRESEERLRLALDAANEGLWDWQVKTGEVYYGPRFYTILGYEPDEFPGSYEAWITRVHPDDADGAEQAISDYFEGRRPSYDIDIRMKTKDGHWIWVETHGTVVERDEEGNPVRMVGTLADITERKEAEQGLRQSEAHKREFYRRTILAATEGKLVICDQEEIRSIAGPPVATWEITGAQDIGMIRSAVATLAMSAGMDEARSFDLLFCIGEATTNAYKHAGGGTTSLHAVPDGLLLVISDQGPGMEAMILPEVALVKGYSTAGTLGMGYKVMISLADKVYLATGPTGTIAGIQMALEQAGTPENSVYFAEYS
ncbi:MAG: PAS domain S-box protein, partial [Armatimonadetes bacterium]|nr:PAS domain S-box protein [Armatimonadota bacterium]